MKKRTLLFNIMCLTPVVLCQTVHVVDIEPSSSQYMSKSNVPSAIVLSALQPQSLKQVVPGSWEELIISASKSAIQRELVAPFGTLTGFKTSSSSAGDVLVARWEGSGEDQTRIIWLYDTPYETIFVLDVDPKLLGIAEFTRYCETLFTWKGLVKSLQLVRQDPTQLNVSALVSHPHTEVGNWSVSFSAMADGISGYVLIGISKPTHWGDYPEDAFHVQERFPPLRERLPEFSRAELFSELSKGFGPAILVATYPANRSRIVLRELLSRGPLSPSELKQILLGPMRPESYGNKTLTNMRLNDLIRVLSSRKELPNYSRPLSKLFQESEQFFHPASLGGVMAAMARAHVDFTSEALELVRFDRFASVVIDHLKTSVNSEETLRDLERIYVNPNYSKDLEDAKAAIKKRLQAQ